MRNLLHFICCALFFFVSLEANLPSDITFLIADLKYNETDGVKICEVQQGSLSGFTGYDYLNGTKNYVENYVADYLLKWQKPVFFIKKNVPSTLERKLTEKGAFSVANMTQLFNHPLFLETATLEPDDPTNLADYGAIVIAAPKHIPSLTYFKDLYPGAIVLEAATYPYWIDKYKMTQLFTDDPVLEAVKPSWGLFPKIYTPTLAQEIAEELGGDRFVIKPRGSFLGNGIIFVTKDNLDAILYKLIEKKGELPLDPDTDLHFWYRENENSFIVEKFCYSDPVVAPHLDNKIFDGTMRAVILLTYQQGKIHIDFPELHWNLPSHSLQDKATFRQHHISLGQNGHYAHVSPEVQEKVKQQLSEALPRLYQRMLGLVETPQVIDACQTLQ